MLFILLFVLLVVASFLFFYVDDWLDKIDEFFTDTAKAIFVDMPIFAAYMFAYLLIPSLVGCALIIGLNLLWP